MPYNNSFPYFRAGEGAYVETLNTCVVGATAFELIPHVSLPADFPDKQFSAKSPVSKAARFMDVTTEECTGSVLGSTITLAKDQYVIFRIRNLLSLYRNLRKIIVHGIATGGTVKIDILNKDTKAVIRTINNNTDVTSMNITEREYLLRITNNSNVTWTMNKLEIESNMDKTDPNSNIRINANQIIGLPPSFDLRVHTFTKRLKNKGASPPSSHYYDSKTQDWAVIYQTNNTREIKKHIIGWGQGTKRHTMNLERRSGFDTGINVAPRNLISVKSMQAVFTAGTKEPTSLEMGYTSPVVRGNRDIECWVWFSGTGTGTLSQAQLDVKFEVYSAP